MSPAPARAALLSAENDASLAQAATCLLGGGLVALPTETVYGLAACAHLPDAVARVFAAKGRPSHDPLIVHVEPEWPALLASGVIDPEADLKVARQLADAFWPGPLTILMPRGPSLDPAITAGQPLVAIRAPAHPVFVDVLQRVGHPLVAPSANRFGHVSPTTAEHVEHDLGSRIDLIVDGGPCTLGLESTVVLPGAGGLRVLRHGTLTLEALRDALSLPVTEGTRVLERPLAPGQLARHYATRAPLRLLAPHTLTPAPDAALLVLAGPTPSGADDYGRVVSLSPEGDLGTSSRRLYAALRDLDQHGIQRIDVVPCTEQGLGAALMDRLRRAAASA